MMFALLPSTLCLLAGLQDELRPGLLGEYYTIGEEFDDFPALGARKPALRLLDPEIKFQRTSRAFGQTDLTVFFCVRWTGHLRVANAGRYTFYLASDDGSRLLLDGNLVVNNGGLHGYEEEKGEVELSAGDHELRVDYFQCGGESGCHLFWSRKGLAKEIVPASALFHRKDPSLDR